jgi:hypothetical protein
MNVYCSHSKGSSGPRASEIVHVSNELVEIGLRLAVPLLRFLYV